MSHQVAILAFVAVLLLCSRGGGTRVRLNSIRTVTLGEKQALLVNRSLWEPSWDLTCMSDLECSEGSFCQPPTKGPAHSRCRTCRRRKQRCHRDSMCCLGNRCIRNVCLPDQDSFVSQRILDSDGGMSPLSKERGWRKRRRTDVRGQVGDLCLRSSDCSDGFCCARHFWTRICKPVLQEGQVCTRHRRGRRKGTHGPELFQRCPCGDGLGCRTLREFNAQPLSTSSLLLAAAKKSKFSEASSSSRHSSPHKSLLSLSAKASSVVAKTRLHVCQRK